MGYYCRCIPAGPSTDSVGKPSGIPIRSAAPGDGCNQRRVRGERTTRPFPPKHTEPRSDNRSELNEDSQCWLRRRSAKARAPATEPANANASPELVRKPVSKAATRQDIPKPANICPQNRAVRQGGGTVPSGLLQPPGRSSSAVTRVPTRGQPTKLANAESPHPRPVAKWSTRVTAEPNAG